MPLSVTEPGRGLVMLSMATNSLKFTHPKLILVATGGGILFSSRCPFLLRERDILADLGYFVANLHTF